MANNIPLHSDSGQMSAVENAIDQALGLMNTAKEINEAARIIINGKDNEPIYDSQSNDPKKRQFTDQTAKNVAQARRTPPGQTIEGVDELEVKIDNTVVLHVKDSKTTVNAYHSPASQRQDTHKSPSASSDRTDKTEPSLEERTSSLVKTIAQQAKRDRIEVPGKIYQWSATPDGEINISKNGSPILTHTEGKTESHMTKEDIDHFSKALQAKSKSKSKELER